MFLKVDILNVERHSKLVQPDTFTIKFCVKPFFNCLQYSLLHVPAEKLLNERSLSLSADKCFCCLRIVVNPVGSGKYLDCALYTYFYIPN